MSPCLQRLSIRPLFEDEEHLQLMLSSFGRVEYLISHRVELFGCAGYTGGQGVADWEHTS